ncbi:MAG TPA: hypothetical protein VJN02_03225 [Gammaproteobacteria bacterium]|nr:hypothetical protein [Gammaproteobacteria bacterium]
MNSSAFIGDFRIFHLATDRGTSFEITISHNRSKRFSKLTLEQKVIDTLRRIDDHIYHDCEDDSLFIL